MDAFGYDQVKESNCTGVESTELLRKRAMMEIPVDRTWLTRRIGLVFCFQQARPSTNQRSTVHARSISIRQVRNKEMRAET